MKKVKKVIGGTILAVISIAILSVPTIEMGWIDKLIILALVFALFVIMYWVVGDITED